MIAIIPDILLLFFPFLMLAFKLFLTQAQTAHKNFAFAYLFILLICQNFVLIGDTQVYFSNWQIDTFGIFMREIFTLSALLALQEFRIEKTVRIGSTHGSRTNRSMDAPGEP